MQPGMKTIVAAILAFGAASMALPLSTRDVQKAVDDCGNANEPDLCGQVVTAINGWDLSVNEVNNFLNTANALSGGDLTDAEFSALRFANLEPGFLSTLQSTPGLSARGSAAAQTLMNVFPVVPQNLMALTQSSIFVSDALNNINNVRCSQILEAIGDLWIESAAAAGADTPGRPLGPDVCPLEPSNTGDGYSNDN